MAILYLLQNPASNMLWRIGLFILLLAIYTKAFPLMVPDEYDNFRHGADTDYPINEERRGKSAALWFHRTGKSDSDPLWFNRVTRSNEEYVKDIWMAPPLWFHRIGKAQPVAGPMRLHGKQNLHQQISMLTKDDLEMLQEILEGIRKR